MDAKELREYISSTDHGYKVLESLGCHSIKEKGNEIRCALPNHSNPTSVCLYKETMKVQCYSEPSLNGDLFSFVMGLKNLSFGRMMRTLHDVYKVPYGNDRKPKVQKPANPLEVFQNVRKEYSHVDYEPPLEIHDMIYMNSYPVLHESWVREGITKRAMEEFDIRYSPYKNAIIIPIRYWQTGYVVAINQRTVVPYYKELGIQKYNLSYSYKKNINLYGLYENYAEIQNKKRVVVFEAEKSVLKRYSRLDGTSVAIHGHQLSKTQADILVMLNVEIIIAFDKDVDLFKVRSICEMMWMKRNVYYIYDDSGLLGDTDSPADAREDEYEYLFMTKIYYDEHEHDEYIKQLEAMNKRKGGALNG